MSRIGKAPITVPGGVTVDAKGSDVTVKGPKGTLQMTVRPEVEVKLDGATATVELTGHGAAREARAFHGLTRALLNNMVTSKCVAISRRDVRRSSFKKNSIWSTNSLVLTSLSLSDLSRCHPSLVLFLPGISYATVK